MDEEHGPIKKCLMTVTTVVPQEPFVSSVVISELPRHSEFSELSEYSETVSISEPEQVPSPAMLDFIASNHNSPVHGPPLVPADPPPAAANSPAVNKRKKNNAPVDVNDLRCSRRLAGLSVGFKNEAAAVKAKEMARCKKNLSSEFEHVICNPEAGPPPELPLETIQAIAVKQCLIPPEEVSGEKLMAPASHD